MTGSAVSISNSSFKNDTATGTGNGGGISEVGSSNLQLTNTNFTNEQAGGNGGAIDSESSVLSVLELSAAMVQSMAVRSMRSATAA